MTDEQQTLLLVRGQIASLPQDDQVEISVRASTIRNVVGGDDKGWGTMALVLVGAEMAAKD